jgi:hypothetical protein
LNIITLSLHAGTCREKWGKKKEKTKNENKEEEKRKKKDELRTDSKL